MSADPYPSATAPCGATVAGITHSFAGRAWTWRGGMARGMDDGFRPDSLLTDLLLARGVPREALDRHRAPTLRAFMPDPALFRDMDRAAERLADAVAAREPTTIFGDYDVDGATSAALLIRFLRMLGHDARAYIPDRMMEGYGPSGAALLRLAEDGARLIVTVDCGAMAHEALTMAHDAGVTVIVVDHHKCTDLLPPAYAIVNPNRLDEQPDAAVHGHMAAVGVAFLLAAATVRTLRARGYFTDRPEPPLLDLLDLVALGTVADVAPVRGINRAFVGQGLKVMAAGRNAGLTALLHVAGLKRAPGCADLGFALGPRINAGGRVGRSDLGVRLLTTDDPAEAALLANELDALNADRRAIEAAVQAEAEALLTAAPDRPLAVLAGTGWHPGVIGIVAGRIKERTGRPAIVIALDEQGAGKGSGRSIPGVDLGGAIIAAREAGLLVAGGGHAMAAGLTVAAGGVPALTDFLAQRLAEPVARAGGERALPLDIMVAPRGLTGALVDALEAAGPFGIGWPAPRIVVGPVRLVEARLAGSDHLRVIAAGDDGGRIKAIAFRAALTPLGQALLTAGAGARLWLAGRPRRDDWTGGDAAELHLEDAATVNPRP